MSLPPPISPYPRESSQPPVPSRDEASMAMTCWVLTILAGILPSIIFYCIAADKPYLRRQAALCLTLSLAEIAALLISVPLLFLIVGFILLPLVIGAALVISIMGAVACSKGEDFRPPLINDLCAKVFKL